MMFGSTFTEKQAKEHLENMDRHIANMPPDDQLKIRVAMEALRGMAKIDPICISIALTYVAGETMMDLMLGKYRR